MRANQSLARREHLVVTLALVAAAARALALLCGDGGESAVDALSVLPLRPEAQEVADAADSPIVTVPQCLGRAPGLHVHVLAIGRRGVRRAVE